MPQKENSIPAFAREAVLILESILSNVHREKMTLINRVNQGELFILKILHSRQEPTRPSELSASLKSSTARISNLLRALEKKGQIFRQVELEDRRNVSVTITEEGSRRIQEEVGYMRQQLGLVFTAMGAEECQAFLELSSLFSELVKTHMEEVNLSPFL